MEHRPAGHGNRVQWRCAHAQHSRWRVDALPNFADSIYESVYEGVPVTVYEQLAAAEALLHDLLAEKDAEALRARLREGPYPGRAEIEASQPNYPFEAFAAGLALDIAILARQLHDTIFEHLERSGQMLVGQRSDGAAVGPPAPMPPACDEPR
jgi:hypothetical protein